MKKRYILAALAAMAVLAGCGNDTSGKAADNTTEDASDTADTFFDASANGNLL